MMNEYKDYGWKEEKTDAHDYLYPVLKSMLDIKKNKCILDVGCGSGYIANKLIGDGFNVYGIDASESGIKLANATHKGRFYVQNIDSKRLPDELNNIKFDTIISTEVIEHLYNPRAYMEFCKNILMKNGGGEMIISTPYHGYIKNLLISLLNGWDKHFTVLWDGGHIKFWSKKTLTQLLNEFDFQIIEFKGAGRLPYLWKSMFIKAKI